MSQKYLITYVAEFRGDSQHGMDITENPLEWLAECQQNKETYFIVNSIPITDEQAEKYNGEFKGM
ncbi:hypothetical protein [Burkholderia cenocepacia]|uniref:hypothetical protein n=1 Tax=Burkholderia cenocepacia TaxID=95486 RepID=UPI000757CA32|nr:hypothetical protein [Burkholderia cenocepacia]AOK33929.1 hypothetical protein WL90_06485 [Burkholderia cenocepacia]KWF74567.1 hypothetical protein WL89_30920 [Burkholderia cenocepacia]